MHRSSFAKPTAFSYGTVETAKGLAVQRGDGAMGEVADFAYLKSKVPYPFSLEYDPGPGIHVHDKFIVIDFNGENPTVFTGSSNLAEGGEQANGDSLIMIEDRVLAPLPAWGLGVEKITAGAIQALLAGLLVFPFVLLIHAIR